MAHGVAGMGDGVARFHSEHGGAGECCSATHSAAGRCREVTKVTVFITISCPPVALLASPSLVQVV